MSSYTLIRRCGVSAVLAGALFVAADLLDLLTSPATDSGGFGADAFEEAAPDTALVVQSGMTLLAGLLLLFELIGLYLRRAEDLGLLGLFGFSRRSPARLWRSAASGRTPSWRPP